jgi:dissimilatory sulfite reductase (desulfoviridin) alpha/beta subunit
MKWSSQAEEAVSKVPFFVRRRVRKRVEEEARRVGSDEVTLEHVRSCQQRFLANMDQEVKGYQVETCFGPSGCPNRAVVDDELVKDIEQLVAAKNLRAFLKDRIQGPLKMHHEFRVSVSDCPNACSRPQIADFGLVGAVRPELSDEPCSQCRACIDICREDAVTLAEDEERPALNLDKCVSCGQCVSVCPTGALKKGQEGYRVLLGGKLGRHPQLATELEGVYPRDQVLQIVEKCLHHFMTHNVKGERFGEILNRTGTDFV